MRIITGETGIQGPTAVAVGKFDGVHLGHRALLHAAEATGLEWGVATFDRHPAEILSPQHAPPYITPLPEKLRLLEEAGAAFCLLLKLDDGILSWPAEAFVNRVLTESAHAGVVLCGPDFRYGQGRKGDVTTLREAGESYGFDVTVVPPLKVDGERVSSYGIRQALSAGDLAGAESMLGRRHSVIGAVFEGRKLGRTLGFPTANVGFTVPTALPSNGIYAVTASWDGETHPAVASLGTRPTVETGPAPVWLEVYVMDWSGDLYGREVRVTFVDRLRDEVKFDSLEALTAQIVRDVEVARERLEGVALKG